ncbi:MAG: hypothetical protein ACTSWY_05735 [Promethearchaeota archaeon]
MVDIVSEEIPLRLKRRNVWAFYWTIRVPLFLTKNYRDDSRYYWTIRSRDNFAYGPSAIVESFIIDTDGIPNQANLQTLDGYDFNSGYPALQWDSLTENDISEYQIQVDDNSDWGDGNIVDTAPSHSGGGTESFIYPNRLDNNEYWERVRGIDSWGRIGSWSNVRSFNVIAIYCEAYLITGF